jgi:hypothetical protein
LTYYFNSNYGSKPDTGASVWLVEGGFSAAENEHVIRTKDNRLIAVVGGDLHRSATIVKHSVADGDGNFDFSDVPIGQYTLIVQSSHSNGMARRDLIGKVKLREVRVNAGETADASLDFGTAAF